MKAALRTALEGVSRLATAGKWRRWWHRPLGYPTALLHRTFIYGRRKTPLPVRAATFFGTAMQLLLPSGMDIYLTGGKAHDSEIRLARFFIEHLRPQDTVLDIGAHYGYFTLLAAALVGSEGRVVALEAAPATYRVLLTNVAGASNVEPHALAASDTAGNLTFFEFSTLYAEYNTLDVSQYAGRDWFADNPPVPTQVPATTVSELVQREALRPNLIKIDVEGAEQRVITGALAYLDKHPTTVVMEYLSADRDDTPHQAAEAALRRIGYLPHRIGPDGQLHCLTDIPLHLRAAALVSDNIVFKRTECA